MDQINGASVLSELADFIEDYYGDVGIPARKVTAEDIATLEQPLRTVERAFNSGDILSPSLIQYNITSHDFAALRQEIIADVQERRERVSREYYDAREETDLDLDSFCPSASRYYPTPQKTGVPHQQSNSTCVLIPGPSSGVTEISSPYETRIFSSRQINILKRNQPSNSPCVQIPGTSSGVPTISSPNEARIVCGGHINNLSRTVDLPIEPLYRENNHEDDENIVREDVYQLVRNSEDKFRELRERFKNVPAREVNPVKPEDISDPKTRELLEKCKYIKVANVDNCGKWKDVYNKKSCRILLDSKTPEELIRAFEEIAEFIKHTGCSFDRVGVRMFLTLDPTDTGVYVSPRRPEQFSSELLLSRYMQVAQSNSNFYAANFLDIQIDGLIEPRGGMSNFFRKPSGDNTKNKKVQRKKKTPSSSKKSTTDNKKVNVTKKRCRRRVRQPTTNMPKVLNSKNSLLHTHPFMRAGLNDCFLVGVASGLLWINGYKTPEDYKQGKPKYAMKKYTDNLRRHMNNIATAAGVDFSLFTGEKLPGIDDYDKIQAVMCNYTHPVHEGSSNVTQCYQIVVYNLREDKLYEGKVNCRCKNRKTLNLLLGVNHFDYIKTLPGFFEHNYFCEPCGKGYSNRHYHKCAYSCSSCFSAPPCYHKNKWKKVDKVPCGDCGRYFYNNDCFWIHKRKNICKYVRYCKKCENMLSPKHECGKNYCKQCQKNVEVDHYCTMPVYEPENFRVKDHRYVFFDLETMLTVTEREGFVFVPNLCVSEMVCDECMDIDESSYECPNCKIRQKVFWKDANTDVIDQFLAYLFEEGRDKRITVISHNGRAFDNLFILKKIYDSHRGLDPSIVAQGTKLFLLKFGNIRFIDSLNFFPCALSKLPALMGFKDTLKGFFPHLFNTPENQGYVGEYPDMRYFSPETMSSEEKERFEKWYETVRTQIFDMMLNILIYCANDTYILRKACCKFALEIEEETGLKVFEQTFTLAAAVNKIFRKNFYKPDSLSITPHSYRMADKQSEIANLYLLFLEQARGIKIQSAYNGREKVITCPPNIKYKVDGYFIDQDGTKVVVEFNGCHFHAHDCMYGNPLVHSRNIFPNEKTKKLEDADNNVALRRERTERKRQTLEKNGYRVITMWECDFREFLQKYPNVLPSLKENYYDEPLVIRDSFFGGSVDATCTYYKCKDDEKINYMDFTSLYPTVNFYDPAPTGPPKRIIIGHEECSKIDFHDFNGFIKAHVLPPKNIFFGVLPHKVSEKLMFPLCITCASEESSEACQHADHERSFTGTFVSIEFKLALEMGYKIVKLFEVQEFEVRNDLFREYIQHFYVKKILASGAPEGMDLDEFIEQCREREGIHLERDQFEKNPAKRSLAKLMLNTLWGKFGEKPKGKHQIIEEPAQLFKLVNNADVEITGIHIINANYLLVAYEEISLKPLNTSSVAVASFVTACARVRLYKLLNTLGKDTYYFDTDSVIYKTKGEQDPRIKTGVFLGDLTDELSGYGKGSYITQFASGGPKNYAARGLCPETGKEFEICKVKGITLNYQNKKIVNFDTVFEQANSTDKQPVFVEDNVFVRDRDSTVRVTKRRKEYRSVLSKRRRVGNRTYPYGYDESLITPED